MLALPVHSQSASLHISFREHQDGLVYVTVAIVMQLHTSTVIYHVYLSVQVLKEFSKISPIN